MLAPVTPQSLKSRSNHHRRLTPELDRAQDSSQFRRHPAEATEGKPDWHSTPESQQTYWGPTLHVLFNLVSPSLQTRPNEVQLFLGNHVRSWTFRHFCWWTGRLERRTRFLLWRGMCQKESCIVSPGILPF